MQRSRSQAPGWLILSGLAVLTSCGVEPPPVAPVAQDSRFLLRIAADGALFLDGEAIARRGLAAEAVRLASRSKVDARLAGKVLDPSLGVPGTIDIEAAGELPLSMIIPLVLDCQAAGFRRWSYSLTRDFRDPPEGPRGGTMPSIRIEKSDDGLPDELRTLPIQLKADEQGKLSRLKLDEREFSNTEALKVEIGEILADPAVRFDRAFLKADEDLHFSELVLVMKMLSNLNINHINIKIVDAADSD